MEIRRKSLTGLCVCSEIFKFSILLLSTLFIIHLFGKIIYAMICFECGLPVSLAISVFGSAIMEYFTI